MRKPHLLLDWLLAAIAAMAIVGGTSGKALLQPPAPPAPPQDGLPSLPDPGKSEKPSLPEKPASPEKPSLPNPGKSEKPAPPEKPALPDKPSLPEGGLPEGGLPEGVSVPNQEELVDMAANLVIGKFQGASCEELAETPPGGNKSAQGGGDPQAAMQEKAIALLKQNPELREAFINRVAPPIANKMFDCGIIP